VLHGKVAKIDEVIGFAGINDDFLAAVESGVTQQLFDFSLSK